MQEMNGMISVIVPVYNGETYLTECIQSVQRQSYEHWELIAVDDGSTDGSAEILNAFAREDSRIRVIHCENGGVSRARNRAMEEARGEFLTFLDGDDCLVTDALKVMYSQIGTADILIAEMTRRRTNVRGGGYAPIACWDRETAIRRCIEDNPKVYTACGKLFRRRSVGTIRFPEGRRRHEDSHFVFCCMCSCHCTVVIDAELYYYRLNEASVTRSVPTLEDIQDIVDSMEERYRLVLEKFPQFSDIAPNLLLKGYMTCAENLAVLPDQAVFWKTVSYCRKIKQLKPYFLPVDEWDEERIQWMTRGAFFRILWIRIKVWLGILKD